MNTPRTTASPELTAAIDALKARDALKRRLQSIDIAIADQEGKLAQARAAQPSTEKIEAERRVLYAAAATGEVTPAEREKREADLNAALAKARGSVAEAERQIEPIELAISELRVRREKNEASLGEAEEHYKTSCVALLRGEAERLCGEYVSAALALKDSFMRINVIHDLIVQRTGGKGGVRGTENGRIYVPAFDLQRCAPFLRPRREGATYTAGLGCLFDFSRLYGDDATRTPDKVTVRESESARLRALGIEL